MLAQHRACAGLVTCSEACLLGLLSLKHVYTRTLLENCKLSSNEMQYTMMGFVETTYTACRATQWRALSEVVRR